MLDLDRLLKSYKDSLDIRMLAAEMRACGSKSAVSSHQAVASFLRAALVYGDSSILDVALPPNR